MDKIASVKKMQEHAAEAAVQLSSLVDVWVDMVVGVQAVDGKLLRDKLDSDARAMANVLVLANQLKLSSGSCQVFSIATFLKRELIFLSEKSPEFWMGKL